MAEVGTILSKLHQRAGQEVVVYGTVTSATSRWTSRSSGSLRDGAPLGWLPPSVGGDDTRAPCSPPAMLPTADISDAHPEAQVAAPILRDFGAKDTFCGPIATVKVFEDNTLVRATLETDGRGRVLVVDGGGSTRCALVGDRLAALAMDNGWAGVVVFGCIRDSAVIAAMDVGIKALAAMPKKSVKRGEGTADIPVAFAGVTFSPGAWLYADRDGIVVCAREAKG